ncbi:hypothetical protein PHJA_001330600 [Phtheirospermum japonicum]|uniref:S-protein homolog n=1 Tax=Phtheirospermum japonicum TaxID=374723 RepID=A0A830BYK9_9LAMI|nr:hypothetical protein PHJA_001330600 [Phtheirospermum japonicum]
MSIKTIIIHLALSFLLFTNLIHQANCCFFSKIHVGFYNHLPATPPKPLYVHCKSKDDNLGTHTLTPGQSWGFNFCSKPLATLFRCELHWNGMYLNNVVAYNARWVIFNPCHKSDCTWTVSEAGATLPHGVFNYWDNLPPKFKPVSQISRNISPPYNKTK